MQAPMQAPMQAQSWTGIQVETSFFPLAFFLYLCTPTIIINGAAYRKPWGTHFFPVGPGMYSVAVFFRYMWMEQCGANSINVRVDPGRVTRIKYEMPPWMFASGSIHELPPGMPR